jgi:acyl-CoA synthetase (AMP-forming)/AMP-acid ligase II
MEHGPNMQSYEKGYKDFSLPVPETFPFPLDVFDQWGKRITLFWTDGALDKKFTFDELPKTVSGKIKRKELKTGEFLTERNSVEYG